MELEKNTYGLSEGIFQACKFIGLTFPQQPIDKPHLVPSDYFGDDVNLSPEVINKLRSTLGWSEEKFKRQYEKFSTKFFFHKPLKHTQTNLNVYFCDYALFAKRQDGSDYDDYLELEFYNKSFEIRRNLTTRYRRDYMVMTCNDYGSLLITERKIKTNKFFSDFVHRDWLDISTCTFDEFKFFVEKHPRFFSKLNDSGRGVGAEIITIEPQEDLSEFFAKLKSEDRPRLLEELVRQHKSLAAFCPDTVNTLRVNTLLDVHNNVHIMSATGKFGRMGGVVDNVSSSGGYAVIVNPLTGIVISDGLSKDHERFSAHGDTDKVFKGFQYPVWEKLRSVVIKMAKMIPQVRYIGWDVTINDEEEIVLIETNAKRVGARIQQAADSVGRFPLYKPFIEEMEQYNREQMRFLGYRINNLRVSGYKNRYVPDDSQLRFAIDKLIPDCKSLLDLGCQKAKFVKSLCPKDIQYYPVDFKKHDDGVVGCNFNKGDFPNIKADTCFCAFTAEYVEPLPQFLSNVCRAAQKQVLMLSSPLDLETKSYYRWSHPFLTDFTEEFLIKTMKQNNFELSAQYPDAKNRSIILYDFRRLLTVKENL